VIDAVRRYGAPERCLFVIGEADTSPGLQWITPYAACTMAEHFMMQGRDVLLVIDDLTKHAAVYREISLLLRRPPGREAYPGDIFYIHSRLLERAAKLAPECGGGSLTAIPIAETQAGNLSAYIPTNLISITDGQIYLDPQLFYENQKPSVDVGRSVSRVGGKAQAPVLKAIAESLRLEYAQFLELVALLLTLAERLLDEVPLERIGAFREGLRGCLSERCPEVLALDAQSPTLSPQLRDRLKGALTTLVDAVSSGTDAAGAPS
jgi:proton translocating ATP synthase F1 alpha subunit